MQLSELDELPRGILDLQAHELYRLLDGPTLLHLPGERAPALFVSVLLHGNEQGGWEALRRLLGDFTRRGEPLPRAMTVLVGNVEAARFRLRRLDSQPDYNRVWKEASNLGAQQDGPPEVRMARDCLLRMRERGMFAAVDVHNNTGVNPHYACITRLDPASIALARAFARTMVLVRTPDTVLAAAFAPFTTTVILEAGRPGEQRGVEEVERYLRHCLTLEGLPDPDPQQATDLFETVATVRLRPGVHFGFTAPGYSGDVRDLQLLDEFEHFNFDELPAGTLFGHVRPGAPLPLEVTDIDGRDVADRYFRVDGDELRLAQDLVPAMFSPDPRIIRQDVVCYFMQRVPVFPP